MERVLICGISCRAAAESAARAGFQVVAVDAFADLDQHPAVQAWSVTRDFNAPPTAAAMARAAASLTADAVCYLSPFENHPHAVSVLAAGRSLWGNSADTLRRVRDPLAVHDALVRNGIAVPRISNDADDPNGSTWLVKPFRSGGGNRIRLWAGARIPALSYLQEYIDGTAGSIVFCAAGGQCVPLGFSRQLVGDPHFGASGYRYCGSILASPDDPQFTGGHALFTAAIAVARCIAAELHLVGINGIDFIARGGVPYPIEVNPRWSASVEVAERAFGLALFGAHADACRAGKLPAFELVKSLPDAPAVGKAIVYAQHSGVIKDTRSWLDDATVRDIPRAGEFVRAGQPICSVLATGRDSDACYRSLVARARQVYARISAPFREPARPASARSASARPGKAVGGGGLS
jgi:predicted ATP-grasp superfamily ATP-dependent carboligase